MYYASGMVVINGLWGDENMEWIEIIRHADGDEYKFDPNYCPKSVLKYYQLFSFFFSV